ncbi:MAG: hypothetical protein ACK5N9_08540, partial [Pirellula sp.]
GRIVANFGADHYDGAGRVDFRETSGGWLNCSRSPCQRAPRNDPQILILRRPSLATTPLGRQGFEDTRSIRNKPLGKRFCVL